MSESYCKKNNINIQNFTKKIIDKRSIRKLAKRILEKEKGEGDISIVFVDPEKIKDLNKRYRNKNEITDVLSFDYSLLNSKFFKRNFELGEIFICLAKVKENARDFKLDFEKELKWVIIHGILHLLGYDHEKSEKQAIKMREKEKNYLKNL